MNIKNVLSIWLMLILGTIEVTSQDLDKTFELASLNLSFGNFQQAESLYRRVLFFDSLGLYEKESLRGLAIASFQTSKVGEASNYFLLSHQLHGEPADYYNYVTCLLHQEDFLSAKRALYSIPDSSLNVKTIKYIFLGLSEFGLDNMEASNDYFNQVNEINDLSSLQDAAFERMELIHRKGKIKALLLSAFVPGAGMAYSKHWKEGTNSLALISAMVGVYFYTAQTLGAMDAIITVLPWLHRYYVGGLNLSVELLGNYKKEQMKLHYNELVGIYSTLIDP